MKKTFNAISRYCFPQSVCLFYLYTSGSLVKSQDYVFPSWANAIGWLLMLASISCVPVYAIYEVYLHEGTLLEVRE